MSEVDENPFVESTVANPFDDPSIREVTEIYRSQFKLDDYNPFNTAKPDVNPTVEPTVCTETKASTVELNIHELLKRQEDLAKREEELKEREEKLRKSYYATRRDNWPPLPERCCFHPCFYQDIQVDIPLEFQNIVEKLYYLWILHGVVMVCNAITGLILNNLTIFFYGLFFAILFTPCSYICWFRPAYKAFRSDSSFNFLVFFCMFFVQFVITAIQAIGLPHSGTVGVVTAIENFGRTPHGVAAGVLSVVVALAFVSAASADLMMIMSIHRIYRSSGGSLMKAQQELSVELFRNQLAGGSVAASAMQ